MLTIEKVIGGRKLVRSTVAATLDTFYTVPSGKTTQLWKIDIANADSAARTITLNLGGVAILSGYSLAANSSYSWEGPQVIHAGDTIQAQASTAGVLTLHISGAEF